MPDLISSTVCPLRLLITLSDVNGSGLSVRSCEIVGDEFRNRTSFVTSPTLWDVFKDPLADALNEAVGRLSKASELVILPEFLFEMPGIALAGLNIMVAEVGENDRQIICRFKYFIGSLNAALHPNLGISPGLSDHRDRILTDTLSDVAMPLYNLCKAMQLHDFSEDSRRPLELAKANLDEKSVELSFYMELLKRYVEETAQTKMLPSEPGLHPAAPIEPLQVNRPTATG